MCLRTLVMIFQAMVGFLNNTYRNRSKSSGVGLLPAITRAAGILYSAVTKYCF